MWMSSIIGANMFIKILLLAFDIKFYLLLPSPPHTSGKLKHISNMTKTTHVSFARSARLRAFQKSEDSSGAPLERPRH